MLKRMSCGRVRSISTTEVRARSAFRTTSTSDSSPRLRARSYNARWTCVMHTVIRCVTPRAGGTRTPPIRSSSTPTPITRTVRSIVRYGSNSPRTRRSSFAKSAASTAVNPSAYPQPGAFPPTPTSGVVTTSSGSLANRCA